MNTESRQKKARSTRPELACALLLAFGSTCLALTPEDLVQSPSTEQSETRTEEWVEPEPPARVAVSPSRITMDLDSGDKVQSLKLVNLDEKPVTVKVSVANWDLDERNRVRIVEPNEQSLDQWLVINPLLFTVPGRTAQTIRFSARPRVRPAPGEHRAMVYFEEVLPENTSEKLRINFKIGVAVYGFAADTERTGTLNRFDVIADSRLLEAYFDVSSTGNAHVRMNGNYAVWPIEKWSNERLEGLQEFHSSNEKPPDSLLSGHLPSLPVLGGTRRILPLNVRHRLRPGQYMIGFQAELGKGHVEEYMIFTVPLEIPPEVAAR